MSGSPASAPMLRRPLWFWVGLSFIAHLAVIWLLGERPSPPPAGEEAFRTALAENLAAWAARLPDYDDPQIFALPSLRGFSGAGWLRAAPVRHEFHEWSDEQRWLPLPVEQLGSTFAQYVRVLTEPAPPLPRKAEPALLPLVADVAFDWAPARSRVRLEEKLSRRLAGALPEPPVLAHKEVLRPSVVELVIDEEGRVFTAAILGESGLPAADEAALELARQLQFQPAPGGGLLRGRLTVDWHVQPLTQPLPGTAPATVP
ncbi:MAG: TonB family protein [Verrucomicrobiae bacterium]|nr:TonB family protein [Verrucomicrobiae bacterium]